MIQLPTEIELETLQAFAGPNSISIYSPYIAPNSSDNPNRTQFKNFLKEARQQLSAKDMDNREMDKLLEPADKFLDSEEFRSNFEHSLAIFIGHDFFKFYHLPPNGVTPSLVIGNGFSVQPIIELVKDNPSYFVLLLSHNGAKVLRGDRYNISQIQDFPTAMEQDLNIDEYPNERQTHNVAPASQGKGSERYHGQYNETEVDKEMLVKFFRHINGKMQKILKNEKIPLIIAGSGYLLPFYRQVNTYPHLMDTDIPGDLEHSSLELIRDKAYKAYDFKSS